MVLVKYLPEPGTPDQTETLGLQFDANEPTDVTDEGKLLVLRGNPFFEVTDEVQKPKASKGKGSKGSDGKLEAVDTGDGSYAILQDGATIGHPTLTKEEADSFNALSDEDKAAYVAS